MAYTPSDALKMHHGQLNITLSDVRHMIYDQFPQYACESIELPTPNSRTVSSIFRIGTAAAARFALQNQHEPVSFAAILRSEAAAMTGLGNNCQLPRPRPIIVGLPISADPLPRLIQTWFEGDTKTPERRSRSHRFALDVAGLIGTLRVIDAHGRAFDSRGRGGNLANHNTWMETCFSNSENLLHVPRLRYRWNLFHSLPQSEELDVMSHKDLTPMNILVRNKHFVGVLDTYTFGPADSALDLVSVWHMLDKDQREMMKKTLTVPQIEWKRGAAWAFEQATGLVWYREQTSPAMAASGRGTLERILGDGDLVYHLAEHRLTKAAILSTVVYVLIRISSQPLVSNA